MSGSGGACAVSAEPLLEATRERAWLMEVGSERSGWPGRLVVWRALAWPPVEERGRGTAVGDVAASVLCLQAAAASSSVGARAVRSGDWLRGVNPRFWWYPPPPLRDLLPWRLSLPRSRAWVIDMATGGCRGSGGKAV